MNHLSNAGKEIKRDSPSSGERTGRSPNRLSGVAGPRGDDPRSCDKTGDQPNAPDSAAEEGDGPVGEGILTPWRGA